MLCRAAQRVSSIWIHGDEFLSKDAVEQIDIASMDAERVVDHRHGNQTQEGSHQWADAGWNLSVPDPCVGRIGLHGLDGHQNLHRHLTANCVW